jgi:hypothetical protein
MRAIFYIFLRLYAYNVERRGKAAAAKAIDDAVTQTNTVLVLLCGSSLWILGAAMDADVLQPPSSSIHWTIIIVCVPLLFIVSRSLRTFASAPEFQRLAQRFESSRERRITLAGFIGLPFVCIAILVIAFHVIAVAQSAADSVMQLSLPRCESVRQCSAP